MTTKTEFKALSLLRAAELTKDMETKYLKKLAALAQPITFAEGEVIYHPGDSGKGLYLIETGEIVIETGTPGQPPIILKRLGPGQFFGWSSLFPREQKLFSTRATQQTQAIMIDAERLRSAWQADHNLEYAVIRRAGKDMAQRIKATRQQLADMIRS